ncbi:MAG: hypothetical protein UV52_C0021G0003 [Parcubacteria group bacterium GW2011_GWD1_42_9]|uniref:Uncharacterized protein n=1 Tax=Candidatus Veblenbacteria bacterium RIFOXYD1_FULL_43_11 TaxID=1802429 RepID=A0A1G2QAA0_9BACT|nr:MAG: hypothetical protein UV52_C0021G0003 [Parcubacteria group bacterium GW2011_GWD1_42_9]KKT22358.1 MAG: hypothetical protein UW06_C0012G0002 [Parcubacteria group bacterium GW2011_GWE1_43_8]OHA57484.1 MAG: hypothetical protein A2588_03295 [Candidatus Veblenbacteria bacterium RIFOXYD1_FULL_43_11]HCM45743.1 hypothetical protein [Candidatus Veblenbacteria bacterium]
MGFLKKIWKGFAQSSISAITGTADTIANHYLKLKQVQPQLSDKETYREIIRFRYSIMPLSEEWRYDALMKETDEITNLRDLIFHILVAESPELLQAGTDNIEMTLEVIGERLDKQHSLK